MNPDTFDLLQKTDWDEVSKKVLAFAEWRARHYRWRDGDIHNLVKGMTPEDIVQEVIVRTIEGKRRWDPSLGPLIPWLKDQVKSVMDALYKSESNVYERRVLVDESEPDCNELGASDRQESHVEVVVSTLGAGEQVERQLDLQEQIDQVFAAVDGDLELEQLVNAIINGVERKPSILAKQLGIPVERIYVQIKRLERKIMKHRKVTS